jgi:hypothetical protein
LLSLKSLVTSPNEVEGSFMGIQKLDKSKWIDVCAALSIRLLGKRAEIEVVSPIDGILIEAHWLPVFGIAYDPAKDELKIRLDGVDHSVLQPLEMYLDLGFGGVQSLGILDKAKAWQIVLLRDPLMLPRPAVENKIQSKFTQ